MMNMSNSRLLPLLLVLLVSTASARTRGLSSEEPLLRERPSRQAMESIVTLAERRECVPVSQVNQISVEARFAQLQEGCSPEACQGPTSCCRVLAGTSLVCDTSNEYPFSACVCNDYTRTRSPTKSPSSTPAPAPTNTDGGSTGGNTDSGTDGGNTGGNTGGDGGSTGGNTDGGNTGGSSGGTDGGNTGGGSNSGSDNGATGSGGTDGGNDGNADTSGNTDAEIDRINSQVQAPLEEEDWWMDPTLMGSVGAGILVMCVGVLLLTHKFKKETSRSSRPAKALAFDADESSADPRMVEQHLELESVQSDYELNELPPDEESLGSSRNAAKKNNKCCNVDTECCEIQACNDTGFGSWMDNLCAPKRARSYDAKNTVDL